jgi:hypothetical protein
MFERSKYKARASEKMENTKTRAESTFGSRGEKIQLPARDSRYDPHSTPSSETRKGGCRKPAETGKVGQRASLQRIWSQNGSSMWINLCTMVELRSQTKRAKT